jgi:hypothetical protein
MFVLVPVGIEREISVHPQYLSDNPQCKRGRFFGNLGWGAHEGRPFDFLTLFTLGALAVGATLSLYMANAGS